MGAQYLALRFSESAQIIIIKMKSNSIEVLKISG